VERDNLFGVVLVVGYLADPAEGASFELSTHYDRGGARARLHNTRGGGEWKGTIYSGLYWLQGISQTPQRVRVLSLPPTTIVVERELA